MKKLKEEKKQIIRFMLIMVLSYIGINGLTTYIYYQNYHNSINIMAQILGDSDTEKTDIVFKILKSNPMDFVAKGKQLLKQYGYLVNNENALFERFYQECLVTAIITFILFTIVAILLLRWQKSVWRAQRARLNQIEKTIVNFRENKLEVFLQEDDLEEQEKIEFQLDALGNHLKLLKEEARLEREGTKELVSDISHQLKTPVAALDTCFSVLLRENLNQEEQKEFFARCRNALDGLEVLLQSLLQISKLESGMIQIEKCKVPILDTIVTAVNRVYPKALEKNIELVFDYNEELEDYVIVQDKKWLSEAIINVLDNAIKYSPSNSEVFVRLQKRHGFVRIEIEDHGIGIPKQEYHKIFQRFFRGTMPAVKEENGSGIGLFLTREIIERHHGTITVSSYLGQGENSNNRHGSIFVIQLPENE